jgi:prepilin-type N-terminal cleavage/methylation domain-containing protein
MRIGDSLPLSSICNNNKGFTLLEVLVAMALLVILSAALYGTFFSLMRGRETAVAKMEARRELSATLDQLRRELSAACYEAPFRRRGPGLFRQARLDARLYLYCAPPRRQPAGLGPGPGSLQGG